MLKSTIAVVFRSLRRRPGYAVLNVAGLSVGLAACVLIGTYVWHETTYDRFHENADRILRVVETRSTPEGSEQVAQSAAPVGPAMVEEVTGIEQTTRLATFFRLTVERGENRRYVGDYLFTEPSFAEVFDFPVARGNLGAALARPGTVVLTHEAARFYFGDANPVGQTLQVEWMGDVTVEAVLEPLPDRSHLQFSMLFSFETLAAKTNFWADYVTNWTPDSRMLATYVKLADGATRTEVESRLATFTQRHYSSENGPEVLALQPLTDIHLNSTAIKGGYQAEPGRPATITIFSLIALFILGIAVINYVNLATARASERAGEVGVRKALGARPGELMTQFIGEATVLTVLALLLGLTLARAAWPAFQDISGVQVSMGLLASPAVLAGLAAGVVAVAVLAGLYPAFVITRFEPSDTLRSRHTSSPGGARLRRGLVVLQFALSIGLLVATFTVHRQLDYVQSKRLGFTDEHLVTVDINSSDVRTNAETIKQEMMRHPAVRGVTTSSRVPGDWKGIPKVDVDASGGAVQSTYFLAADDAFLETFEIGLKAGRTFDPGRAADTSAVLLNERAVRALNVSDPVGATIRVPTSASAAGGPVESKHTFRVIGVVSDFHFQSLHRPIDPLLIGSPENPIDQIDYFTARVDGDRMTAAIDHLRAVGTTFDPGRPFEYHLLDDQIAAKYATDRRVGTLFGIAAGLAILIACVGVFGLAAFSVQRRRKEIGIRKALGATAASIVGLLSREYALLVAGAFLVAAPVAYLAMQQWLEEFAYQVEVGVGLLLAAGAVALIIAVASVSVQALRAARIDPVRALRNE